MKKQRRNGRPELVLRGIGVSPGVVCGPVYLISTVPLMAVPMSLALRQDRFSLLRVGGLLCGLAGVALIALPRASLPEYQGPPRPAATAAERAD